MTHLLNSRSKPSEADIAFELLQGHGRPWHYQELIEAVLRRIDQAADARQISSVLTQINLDTRFAYIGQGEWGLRAWVPTKGARRLPTITLMNKTLAYDDDLDNKDALEETRDNLEHERELEVDDEDGTEASDFEDEPDDESDDESDEDNWE